MQSFTNNPALLPVLSHNKELFHSLYTFADPCSDLSPFLHLGGPGTMDRKCGPDSGGKRPIFGAAEDTWWPDHEFHHPSDIPFHLRKQEDGNHCSSKCFYFVKSLHVHGVAKNLGGHIEFCSMCFYWTISVCLEFQNDFSVLGHEKKLFCKKNKTNPALSDRLGLLHPDHNGDTICALYKLGGTRKKEYQK